LYFPTEERPETWKALTEEEGKKECLDLHKVLKADGWHEVFTEPLLHADSVLRVGLRARKPIPVWHAPQTSEPRIFLLGDAAHPPVPYIGQGAMVTRFKLTS
jgi:salicylate hydroxylase